jgi:hypothetical protein
MRVSTQFQGEAITIIPGAYSRQSIKTFQEKRPTRCLPGRALGVSQAFRAVSPVFGLRTDTLPSAPDP